MSAYDTQLQSACAAFLRGDLDRAFAEYVALRRTSAIGEMLAADNWDQSNIARGRIAEIDKLFTILSTIAKMQKEASEKAAAEK